MRGWDLERIAGAAGAGVHRRPASPDGPLRATIDSRGAGPGDLFFGLRGEHTDGGSHAGQALQAGAWGVLVAGRARRAAAAAAPGRCGPACTPTLSPRSRHSRASGAASCARAHGIAVTGSTGKTSTKDILARCWPGS